MRRNGVLLLSVTLALVGCATRQPKVGDAPQIPHPSTPVGELLDQLSSPEPATRAAAAWKLAGATESRDEVRAALTSMSNDKDRPVRYAVQWALGHLPQATGGPTHEAFGYSPAKAVRIPRPQYPQDAFIKKIEGKVVLDILIGEDGEVAHAEVRKSVQGLDEAALASVRQWQFQPATRAGQPVASVALVPVKFRIF